LLRVPPGFAHAGAVAQAVQFLADLGVRLALPQFDGLGMDIGVDSPELLSSWARKGIRNRKDNVTFRFLTPLPILYRSEETLEVQAEGTSLCAQAWLSSLSVRTTFMGRRFR
jgi:hypothetical protein